MTTLRASRRARLLRRTLVASAVLAVAFPGLPSRAYAATVGTGTYENSSTAVTFSTPWSTTTSTRDSGGSHAYLSAPGNAGLTFSGTGVQWVTRTNNYSGIAQVYVDGVAVTKVDLYSATEQFQRVVYSKAGMAAGTHSIRIERTGSLNPASTGRRISLDAFVVRDSTAPAAMPTPTLTPSRKGIDVAWPASTATDLAGYRVYRRQAGGNEVLLDQPAKTARNVLDVGLSAGVSYSYRVTAVDSSGNQSQSFRQRRRHHPGGNPGHRALRQLPAGHPHRQQRRHPADRTARRRPRRRDPAESRPLPGLLHDHHRRHRGPPAVDLRTSGRRPRPW